MERVILGKNSIFVFVEVVLGAVAEHRHVLLRLNQSIKTFRQRSFKLTI
jgi:hypothetical protein